MAASRVGTIESGVTFRFCYKNGSEQTGHREENIYRRADPNKRVSNGHRGNLHSGRSVLSFRRPATKQLLTERFFVSVWLGVLICLTAVPARAADTLVLGYGPLSRSIPVAALDTFVRQGTVTPALAPYIQQLGPQNGEQLRRFLRLGIDPGIVPVDAFLHSSLGTTLLGQLGQIVRVDLDRDGAVAIRAALVLAAGRPGGLTPLNFLESFPTKTLYVDGALLSSRINSFEALKVRADQALKVDATAPVPPSAPTGKLNPASQGPYRFSRIAVRSASSQPPADFYLSAAPGIRPIVVISHGWGESRDTYIYLAQRWASHGFHVLAPVHPGSDRQWLLGLFGGRSTEVISPQDFVERPRTVAALLEQLAALARTDRRFAGRLDLQRVGIFGHSLGGDTALAAAGAPLDFSYLTRICTGTPPDPFNLDLGYFVQCRAGSAGSGQMSLRLPQVRAAIASSPTASVLFGETGLGAVPVPTMVVTATDDTVAPAAIEQIDPFQRLPVPTYLLALVGATHFSVQGQNAPSLLPGTSSNESARQALATLATAFWRVYLEDNASYAAYLTPGYVRALGTNDLPTVLLRR